MKTLFKYWFVPVVLSVMAACEKEQAGQITDTPGKNTPEEVTPETMLDLIRLEAPGHGISSLEGLEYAENLETLNVSDNNLERLDPIKGLRNLENLDVSRNHLRDIQPLHGYRQLKRLNISRNKLFTMDVSSIAAMIDLEYLNLERAKIDSLEYLIRCEDANGLLHQLEHHIAHRMPQGCLLIDSLYRP